MAREDRTSMLYFHTMTLQVEFAQKQIATITLNWNYLKMVWIKNKRHGHLGINFNYFKCSSANSPQYYFLSLSGIVWQPITVHGQKARSNKTCDNRFQHMRFQREHFHCYFSFSQSSTCFPLWKQGFLYSMGIQKKISFMK